MNRVVDELDSIHFSIKKASQMVKEIGRQVRFLKELELLSDFLHMWRCIPPDILVLSCQVATDRCIMALLFLIVLGVIAIIIVKVGYVICLLLS